VLAHCSGHHINGMLAASVLKREREIARSRRMVGRPLLDAVQIEQIMPHRFPFMLVDRVIELDPNRRALGLKNVTYNEPFFQGHWPGRPVMPGVLIVEAMAQVAGVLVLKDIEDRKNRIVMLISIEEAKFRRPVVPGDQLRIEMKVIKKKATVAKMAGQATVDGTVVAEATVMCKLADRGDPPHAQP
jgi:beta-hydroxyacyl-ACP dehydratase FabZ